MAPAVPASGCVPHKRGAMGTDPRSGSGNSLHGWLCGQCRPPGTPGIGMVFGNAWLGNTPQDWLYAWQRGNSLQVWLYAWQRGRLTECLALRLGGRHL